VQRVSVVGNSGSGKSTVARALAARLGVPWVELDALYHQAGWQPLPVEEFRARVAAVTTANGWVVDGNYPMVQDLVWSHADTVVWLDPPRWRVMGQLIWRSVKRAAFGTRLWNGNRERWRNLFTTNPEQSVVAWAWHQHPVYRRREEAVAALEAPDQAAPSGQDDALALLLMCCHPDVLTEAPGRRSSRC
jgi:adenylate kinase family enzyme